MFQPERTEKKQQKNADRRQIAERHNMDPTKINDMKNTAKQKNLRVQLKQKSVHKTLFSKFWEHTNSKIYLL